MMSGTASRTVSPLFVCGNQSCGIDCEHDLGPWFTSSFLPVKPIRVQPDKLSRLIMAYQSAGVMPHKQRLSAAGGIGH